jgi:hypothetical protein
MDHVVVPLKDISVPFLHLFIYFGSQHWIFCNDSNKLGKYIFTDLKIMADGQTENIYLFIRWFINKKRR